MQDPSSDGESASEQSPEKCLEECLELHTPLHLSQLGRFLGPLTAIPELQSPPEEEQPDSPAAEGELPDKEQQPQLTASLEQGEEEDALACQQASRDSPKRKSGTTSRLSATSKPWFPPPREAANIVNVWAAASNGQLSSGPLGLGTPFAGWVPSPAPRPEMHSTWQACSEFGQPGSNVRCHASQGQPDHTCWPQLGCIPQPAYLLPLLPGQQWPPCPVLPFRNPFSLSPPHSHSVQPGYHSLGTHLPASGRVNSDSCFQGYQQCPLPPPHVLLERSTGLTFQPVGAASLQPDAPHPAASMRRRKSAIAASRKLYATATTQAGHEKNLKKIESLCHVLNSQGKGKPLGCLPKKAVQNLVQHQLSLGRPVHAPWFRHPSEGTRLPRSENEYSGVSGDQDNPANEMQKVEIPGRQPRGSTRKKGTGVFLPHLHLLDLQSTEEQKLSPRRSIQFDDIG